MWIKTHKGTQFINLANYGRIFATHGRVFAADAIGSNDPDPVCLRSYIDDGEARGQEEVLATFALAEICCENLVGVWRANRNALYLVCVGEAGWRTPDPVEGGQYVD